MALTSLILPGSTWSIPNKDVEQFIMTLRHQPLLGCLEVWSGNGDLRRRILPTDVPRLKRLVVHVQDASALVQGRPATSLTLLDTRRMPEGRIWEGLAASTTTIVDLTIVVRKGGFLEPLLYSISIYFPGVQNLALDGAGYDEIPVLNCGFHPSPRLRNLQLLLSDYSYGRENNLKGQDDQG
ncbi:hypothetical protein FRB96_002801 [Tulasnella sp. 330]|nr:hypothetical protein FRB96_002801 [Tulasnella sp. 330]